MSCNLEIKLRRDTLFFFFSKSSLFAVLLNKR
uniref:Uncharacterized protein n=1 Tax=Rhizophora mucronata TaxID=61149 RepID=A0A2P2QFE6_RHIMU